MPPVLSGHLILFLSRPCALAYRQSRETVPVVPSCCHPPTPSDHAERCPTTSHRPPTQSPQSFFLALLYYGPEILHDDPPTPSYRRHHPILPTSHLSYYYPPVHTV